MERSSTQVKTYVPEGFRHVPLNIRKYLDLDLVLLNVIRSISVILIQL